MRNARCALVWSSNPFHANTPGGRALMDALDRGVKLIVVDPRRTQLAARADVHLQLRPGTDGALALGVAHVILEEGLHDAGVLRRAHEGVRGVPRLRAAVRPGARRGHHRRAGGEDPRGRQALRDDQAGRAHVQRGPVVHHANGVQNARAVYALIGLTGNFDVAGGNRPAPFSWLEIGGAGFVTRQHEFELPRSWDDLPPRVGAGRFPVWAELVDQAQAMDLPRQIRTGDPYPLRALVAFGLNHRMFPGAGPLSGGHPAARLHLRRRPVRHRRLALRRHRAARLQLGGAQRGALLPAEVGDADRAGDRPAR